MSPATRARRARAAISRSSGLRTPSPQRMRQRQHPLPPASKVRAGVPLREPPSGGHRAHGTLLIRARALPGPSRHTLCCWPPDTAWRPTRRARSMQFLPVASVLTSPIRSYPQRLPLPFLMSLELPQARSLVFRPKHRPGVRQCDRRARESGSRGSPSQWWCRVPDQDRVATARHANR